MIDFLLDDTDFTDVYAHELDDEIYWPDQHECVIVPNSAELPGYRVRSDASWITSQHDASSNGTPNDQLDQIQQSHVDISQILDSDHVFPGCCMTVDEFIIQVNAIKLLSRCSWNTIELIISLVQHLLSTMSVSPSMPTSLSAFKTYTARQMQEVDEAVHAMDERGCNEYVICAKCGRCNLVDQQQSCSLCKNVLSEEAQRYVHFPVRRTIARRLATSKFRESLQEGFAQYQDEITKGEEGFDAPYRLNYRRLISDGFVGSWKDIVLNVCVDGVTKGSFAGSTMSFTPIVAQIASMRQEDRADHNNLIVVGILQGSASDTKMDGPLEIFVEDLLASRNDEYRIFLGLLSADHQCLRKLIKCTGDASVCPCERCCMAGLLSKTTAQRGRYIYPFSCYTAGQTYKSHQEIVEKIDSLIATRLKNQQRRRDEDVVVLLKSFSFYGRPVFLQLPEFNLRHSVPIDVMHLAGNAGEFVRELLKDELSPAGTKFANSLLSNNLLPSENYSSGRGFTFGRRWKTADYLHFLCAEVPLIIADRVRLANKNLRIALSCLSAVFRICSTTDAPKAAIVPLDQLCLTFGHHWFNATGENGAKLWAHRVIHMGHVLRSTSVPSDGWLFIYERFFGKLTKSIVGTVRAFEQVRNMVPLLEHIKVLGLAHRIDILAFQSDDDSDEDDRPETNVHVGLRRKASARVTVGKRALRQKAKSQADFLISPIQVELCEPKLLGAKEVIKLSDDAMVEALELVMTVDRSIVDVAAEIVARHRAYCGKEPKTLTASRSLGRRLMHALRWVETLPRTAEFEEVHSLHTNIVLARTFSFQRAEVRASRGKLHIATDRWSEKRKSCDSLISFIDVDGESLLHGIVVDILLFVRLDMTSFVALQVDTLGRSDANDISSSGLRLARSSNPYRRKLLCASRVHHKAVIEPNTDTLIDYDRSWFTIKSSVEELLKNLRQKGHVYSAPQQAPHVPILSTDGVPRASSAEEVSGRITN